jgi:tetratricopeptide (TPR) repeat protein
MRLGDRRKIILRASVVPDSIIPRTWIMTDNRNGIRALLTKTIVIAPAVHRRAIWFGLILQAAFLGLAALRLWEKFPSPVVQVSPSDTNVRLALANLASGLPALLILLLALVLLILLPGWIVSLFLETSPRIPASILYGFGLLGGLTVLSQILHVQSIWPSLSLHLGWQLALWTLVSRQRAARLISPPLWCWLVVGLSMGLLGLFMAYFNPVMRPTSVDNWAYTMLSNGVMDKPGQLLNQPRPDWNAWIAINGWVGALTGIPPLHLYLQLWGIVLTPLLALAAFGIVLSLSGHTALATASAWLTMLALATGSNVQVPTPGTAAFALTSNLWAVASDKWVALVLLTPVALAVLVEHLNRPFSWKLGLVTLLALGTEAIFHPQGLTVLPWLLGAYLATEFIGGIPVHARQKLVALIICAIILFVIIPLTFPRLYSYTQAKGGTTDRTGITLRTYVPVASDWVIVNPVLLASPLLLGPVLLVLFGGLRRANGIFERLERLSFGWVGAVVVLFFPPFATVLDRFWFPTWLDRFVWTLPFGILAALSLRWLTGSWRRGYPVAIIMLSIVLPLLSPLRPDDIDWRLAQEPVVDSYTFDLIGFFRTQQLTGVILTPLPGPQNVLYSELGRSFHPIGITTYGYPDIKRLYATAWWGSNLLKTYIMGQVDWLIVERNSLVMPQIGLQPERYQLVHENPVYLVYRVTTPFRLTPLDETVEALSSPQNLDAAMLAHFQGPDPYSQTIIGLAYQAIGRCDEAVVSLERGVAQSTFARVPYLETLAACRRFDELRSVAASWRDDPGVAATLLSEHILRYLEHATVEHALKNWLARPNNYRDEVATARKVASHLVELRGRPDLAIAALRRLPDVLLDPDDWYRLAHWSELAGIPDPSLYERAGREDLAVLLNGHLSRDLHKAREYYQLAADRSHSSTAYMFLGQACEVLGDYQCATSAFQTVMGRPNDPIVLYATLALIRVQAHLGENTNQLEKLAQSIAEGLSLSYFAHVPTPMFRPPTAGQALRSGLISAHWVESPAEHIPETRLLEITLTRPEPQSATIYSTIDNGAGALINLAAFIPADASISWTVPVAIPAARPSNTPTALRHVSIFEDGAQAFVADILSWLPPKADISGAGSEPLAIFGDELQLWNVSMTCSDSGQATLRLKWLPTKPLSGRYTFFVHVYDKLGKQVSQIDQRPFDDAYPTDLWLTGYAFQITHTVPIGDPPFRIETGWYLLSDGSRLPLLGREEANGVYSLPLSTCPADVF